MPSTEIIRRCIGLEILSAAEGREAELCEIRLRTGRHAVLRFSDGSSTESINITREKLANIVSALQMGSYYAVENQMRQGYFTLQGGIRVGVCGKMNVDS
ncbi:MAG: hypothetical protein IJA26_06730, partial [Clostridia bacterium]|nr:hypothetical protein [Clostridia bacterium]